MKLIVAALNSFGETTMANSSKDHTLAAAQSRINYRKKFFSASHTVFKANETLLAEHQEGDDPKF